MDAHLLRRASDRTAPTYDARFGALQRRKYDLLRSALAQVPYAGDLRGGAWLDAGCGTGLLAEHMGAREAEWTGVDLSAAMLGRARDRGLRPVQADLDALPFAAGAFDAAFCFTALIDRSSAAPALTELSRVVRAGGLLVVTLLPHDLPADMQEVASGCGLTDGIRLGCGQDVAFVWRRGMIPP